LKTIALLFQKAGGSLQQFPWVMAASHQWMSYKIYHLAMIIENAKNVYIHTYLKKKKYKGEVINFVKTH